MSTVTQIGNPPWRREDIVAALPEFIQLYQNRPIRDNAGGMRAPHMFATWFMVRALAPDLIVESGIFKGQGTWLLEQACPTARIVSIDLALSKREYISKTAEYHDQDFSELDWSSGVSPRSLVFFDDHQNTYNRLQQCHWFGFQHAIFEDNYPAGRGDAYSLKQAFAGAGFAPAGKGKSAQSVARSTYSSRSRLARAVARVLRILPTTLMPQYTRSVVAANQHDAALLQRWLDVYYEFPPVFKAAVTRWGDAWSDAAYPTPEPLFQQATKNYHELFVQDAPYYTWICYAHLK